MNDKTERNLGMGANGRIVTVESAEEYYAL